MQFKNDRPFQKDLGGPREYHWGTQEGLAGMIMEPVVCDTLRREAFPLREAAGIMQSIPNAGSLLLGLSSGVRFSVQESIPTNKNHPGKLWTGYWVSK